MRKFTVFLCFLMIFTLFFINQQNNIAISAEENNFKYITIKSFGETEVNADTAELCFGIQKFFDGEEDIETKVNNLYSTLENEIKNIDNSAEFCIKFSLTKPVLYSNGKGFNHMGSFCISSQCFDCLNQIIETAKNNGATIFFGTNYKVKDINNYYEQVINNAKENATKKIETITTNYNLVEITEVGIKTSTINTSNKIKISAIILLKFECPDITFSASANEQTTDTYQNDTQNNEPDYTNTEPAENEINNDNISTPEDDLQQSSSSIFYKRIYFA